MYLLDIKKIVHMPSERGMKTKFVLQIDKSLYQNIFWYAFRSRMEQHLNRMCRTLRYNLGLLYMRNHYKTYATGQTLVPAI